jgi:polysaccharide pyruvyl transferase WcaK-like protein
VLQKIYRLRYGVNYFSYNSIYAILKSDALIISGGVFFDYKLFNPLFNFIFSLYFVLPIAKIMGKLVVPFNTGLGPIRTERGRKMLKGILSSCDFIGLREHEGLDFIRENYINVPVYLGTDPALNNDPTPEEESIELLKKEGVNLSRPILGININVYIDQWVITGEKGLTKREFIQIVSDAVKKNIDEENIQPVMVCTNYADLGIIKELRDVIDPDTVILDNCKYDHHQLMGMMGCMDILIGTRLHACVLAVAMSVPVVSINYTPKVKHFMQLIGMEDYSNDIDNLNKTDLENRLFLAWKRRDALKREIEKRLPDLKMKASYPAVILKRLLQGEPIDTEELSIG